MKNKAHFLYLLVALTILVFLVSGHEASIGVRPVLANGYIDFEDGIDRQPIQSTIPGLEFITTDDQDWIYGDWSTDNYNGKFPDGAYSSNGNFFAWLGENQGQGRINFTEGGATYLSFGVSTANDVTLTGYDISDNIIAQSQFIGGNLYTGRTDELRIDAPGSQRFSYVVVSGQANYWLIDDLSTDADGVPDSRTPLIFIPGIMGTRLNNRNGEVWPNGFTLINDLYDESMLVLTLQKDGIKQGEPDNPDFNITTGGIIDSVAGKDFYKTMTEYLGTRGYKVEDNTLYFFPYDWRRSILNTTADLNTLIEQVQNETGAEKVNLLGHSMGGLVARAYIDSPANAAKIDKMVTLGTPYLGAPKAFDVMHYAHACMVPVTRFGPGCFLNRSTLQAIVLNYPGVHEILPSPKYFDVYPNGHLNMDRDTNGDGQHEGWLDYNEIKELVEQHNSQLPNQAENLYELVDDFSNGTNGVKVYAFVGYGQDAPGTVREQVKRRITNPSKTKIVYDFTSINGDETVPLNSADLGRNLKTADYSGTVSYFYAKLNHGELAKFNNGRTVLRLVADILEVGDLLNAEAYSRQPNTTTRGIDPDALTGFSESNRDAHSVNNDWLPIYTEPEPLSGRQLLIQGNAVLEVEDSGGNIVQINTNNAIEMSIPGSSLHQINDTLSIFVPEGSAYQVRLLAKGNDFVDFKIRKIVNDVVVETVNYLDIEIESNTKASLNYNILSTPDYRLMIDSDGDGVTDIVKQPHSIVDEIGSQDHISPTSDIQIDGTIGPGGWYIGTVTIALSASDNVGGSGLNKIEYTLDNGKTVNVYSEPFTVNADDVPFILVQAIDNSGNSEFPLPRVLIGAQKVMLPILMFNN